MENLTFPPGKLVALDGSSGAKKRLVVFYNAGYKTRAGAEDLPYLILKSLPLSPIMCLLLRFYDAYRGTHNEKTKTGKGQPKK